MPRKKFQPTSEQRAVVQALYGYGLPQNEIRQHVVNPSTGKPISRTVLERSFAPELEMGSAVAKAAILETAFNIATDINHPKCATMNIFLLKTRLGFRETDRPSDDNADDLKKITVEVKDARCRP